MNPDYNVDYIFGKMTDNVDNFDEDMAATVKEEESVGGDFVDVKVEPGEQDGEPLGDVEGEESRRKERKRELRAPGH